MLFNSLEYLAFLPIVFCLYWFVFNKTVRWQNLLILIASYFFYGWWSLQFLGLLALSTLLDYLYGFGVSSVNKKRAKFFLVLSVINNLGILAVFKYYDFFAAQIQSAAAIA
ncbi:MAG: MBOAT family protein, partial [Chitinophagia bacterium]|nr:MBOAT family protein [Chitinophagia bacterium]